MVRAMAPSRPRHRADAWRMTDPAVGSTAVRGCSAEPAATRVPGRGLRARAPGPVVREQAGPRRAVAQVAERVVPRAAASTAISQADAQNWPASKTVEAGWPMP